MIIIGLSQGQEIAKRIARKLKKPYYAIITRKFPDGETYLKYKTDLKNQHVVLVQSFYGHVNDCLIELIFACATAKDLGAKKVTLIAPYFPYLRQDKQFTPNECVSIHVVASIIDNWVDEIFIVDPHLHREKTLGHLFKIKAHKLTAYPLIAEYIRKNLKCALIIGPDAESYKWAENIAREINCDYAILTKERYSDRKVEVKLGKRIKIKNKHVIIIDDIISTGNTILETIKLFKRLGAIRFTVFCIHGIFIENALKRLKKEAKIISCNTIPNPVAKIDISSLIYERLK